MTMKRWVLYALLSFLIMLSIGIFLARFSFKPREEIPTAKAERRDLIIDIKSVGELEASRSIIIASSIRGDNGKLIYLIPDGINVKTGELLVKMDPTPFEEALDKTKNLLKEQEVNVHGHEQALAWEKTQAEHEIKSSSYEVEATEMELEKIVSGDGPLEQSRLKSAMQKAWMRYEELNGYSNDLLDLQEQGFLNPGELKQAQKKLQEEQEAYETAKIQYDSYVSHVFPMQIKKAESGIKKAKIKYEENIKSAQYKIAKAQALLNQSKQVLEDLNRQLKMQKNELEMSEIFASAPGMVVHREEYRSSQKRKPRVGDILVKNQALMDIPDLDSMIVKTKIREIDLFKVTSGKEATIYVDAYPDLSFKGKVTMIGVLAMADMTRPGDEKYFDVRIALEKGDPRLRPGMTTRVTIHSQKIDDALTIPVHAVFQENSQNYCYVIGWTGYTKKAIEIGSFNEHWAEVKLGLKENHSICLVNPFLGN